MLLTDGIKTCGSLHLSQNFNSCIDIVEDFEDPPLLRQRDVYLMLLFEENGFKKEDLKQINFVHEFLCTFILSDITTIDG